MLKKEEYLKTVRRPYPPFFRSLFLAGCSNGKYYKPLNGEQFTLDIVVSEDVWYYSKRDLENIKRATFNSWKNKKGLDRVKKVLKQKEKNFIASTKKSLTAFGKAYVEYLPALITVWIIDEPVEKAVKELLFKNFRADEAGELQKKIFIPLKDNFYKKEEYKLVFAKNLKAHAKKYEWLNSRYGEKHPYTAEQAGEKLSKINKTEFLSKRKKEKEELKKTIKYIKRIVGREGSDLIDLMQFIIYYRTQRTDIINKAGYLIMPKLEKIAKKKGLSYKQLLFCTFDEVARKTPPLSVINERMAGYAMIAENKKVVCVQGKENEKIKEYLKEDISQVREFRGFSACGGIAKGKAKIIFKTEDYKKVNVGDILVANMTTPDMTHIMNKSAAFITEEGGITCHAAIMAREMNKPCIIGTKIATEVLKDGDLVEVDANKGIIKILKR